MKIIAYPNKENWPDLLARPAFETNELDRVVHAILTEVREQGDAAVMKYTKKFDKADLSSLSVSEQEIIDAAKYIDSDLKRSIALAIRNITAFHKKQMPREIKLKVSKGVSCWQKPVPIFKVGLYIPGGQAPLFSTLLMLAIPAKIAGCSEILLCTPPSPNGSIHPAILYAASQVGVKRIFKAGGVQAIAAMAYGTESIPAVYKIFGPGNQYVTAAKQLVARDAVAIDMPAGPSEVAVVADKTSNPAFVASDLLSQAEHGTDSQSVLFCDDKSMIDEVLNELKLQLAQLPKREIATESLQHGKAFLLEDKKEIMDMVNAYAPEHLILSTDDAEKLANQVINAGSVFIGHYTPESAGDYASGTNHTLPTHGWAKAYSGVNLDSYFKKITFQHISKKGLEGIGPAIEHMAEAEELMAHKNAVSLRLKKKLKK
ncbi:MAG: histidinol dehydrogenase [Bacteroidota bacterium]|nr:MAG: histidinol dehydrogenase [Bacteroidota bacterium]